MTPVTCIGDPGDRPKDRGSTTDGEGSTDEQATDEERGSMATGTAGVRSQPQLVGGKWNIFYG